MGADEAPQKGLAPPAPSTPPAPSPSSEGLTFLLWAGVLAVLAFLVYWFLIRRLRRSDTKAEARRVSVSRDLEAGQAEPEAGQRSRKMISTYRWNEHLVA